MRSALTVEKLEEKKKKFDELLKPDDDYKSFKKYFDKTYTSRYQQRADAYLPKFGPCNTNMYLESWHSKLKYKYLGGRKQRRLDYVFDKIVQYDKHQIRVAEHEQGIGFSNKRTSLVLKYHKKAKTDFRDGKYKVTRHHNSNVLQRYVIEEGEEILFVTMKDDDPNHQSCKTCFCLFECTCQVYRKRHNPSIYLHVITLDKKSGFDKTPDSDFDHVSDDLNFDYNDFNDSNRIETKSTFEHGVSHFEPIPEKFEISINTETVRNTCKNLFGDVLCAVGKFPHRAKELL